MTPDTAAILRHPFKPDEIGKLPRIWCGPCRDAKFKNCDKHQKVRCDGCHNTITVAHLHLDYVGHAEVTDRLLQADPEWTWEPVASDQHGLPLLDGNGGLWIRLTVAGVTRLGYGHADGKKGPDAVKEAIGDALRNGAMRFGVALDLWGAKFEKAATDADEPAPAQREQPAGARRAPADAEQPAGQGEVPMVNQAQHRRMHALWNELGYGGNDNRDQRLQITAKILKRELGSSAELTFADANTVIEALEAKRRQQRPPGQDGGQAA